MKTSITITVDEAALPGLTDGYLAALWHAAQANPAPIEDRAAGKVADPDGELPPEGSGSQAGEKEAEAMMILISGTFICNYNRALTGEINSDIIGYIANLTKA